MHIILAISKILGLALTQLATTVIVAKITCVRMVLVRKRLDPTLIP